MHVGGGNGSPKVWEGGEVGTDAAEGVKDLEYMAHDLVRFESRSHAKHPLPLPHRAPTHNEHPLNLPAPRVNTPRNHSPCQPLVLPHTRPDTP